MGEHPTRYLTPKEASDLLIFAGKYSQGAVALDRALMNIVHLLHPYLRVPSVIENGTHKSDLDFRTEVMTLATPPVRKRVHAVAGENVPIDQNLDRNHPAF